MNMTSKLQRSSAPRSKKESKTKIVEFAEGTEGWHACTSIGSKEAYFEGDNKKIIIFSSWVEYYKMVISLGTVRVLMLDIAHV